MCQREIHSVNAIEIPGIESVLSAWLILAFSTKMAREHTEHRIEH
tara:strand:- start:766 stop:900 length:135 start_codon:yes stop_codon:yes gene_type:complete